MGAFCVELSRYGVNQQFYLEEPCCVSFWFWRLRPEKKVPVVCLAGCAVVSVFGSGDYDGEKKKFQSSVWRVVDYDLKKNKFESSVWRDVTWFFLLSHDGENFIGN